MKETILGNHLRKVPSIAVGCMRLSEKSKDVDESFYPLRAGAGRIFL